MADKETKTDKSTEDNKTQSDDKDKPLTAGEIRKMVNGMVGEAVSGLGLSKSDDKPDSDKDGDSGAKQSSGTPSFAEGSVRSQVEREINRLKAREARDAKDAEIDGRLAKIDKALEKQPVERRRVHKIMGWGEPD